MSGSAAPSAPWSATALRHNRITLNVAQGLMARLQPGCQVFVNDIKIVTPAGDVMYPDVLVACGQLDGRATWLDAPVILVEVLSPGIDGSSSICHRWACQSVPSLRHCLLVDQDQPVVEVYSWREDGSWLSVIHRDPAAVAALPALGIELPCREIFAGVDFAAAG